MRIYLTRYEFERARIMSMEAVDKGKCWECDRKTARMELSTCFFWAPDLVTKKDAFTSFEDAVASLEKLITEDIAGRQERIQKLYVQLGKLKTLSASTPCSRIQ